MTKNRIIIGLMLSALLLMTGCSADDRLQQVEQTSDPVVVDLALSVSKKVDDVSTRMYAGNIQATDNYRGFSLLRIAPFNVQGRKISINDTPLSIEISDSRTDYKKSDIFYLYENCFLMPTTASFLVYGKAPRGGLNKASSGSLIESFPLDMSPKNIRFELESIVPHVVHSTATALANYMTSIANATGNETAWKNAPSATLRLIYMNFLNVTETDNSGDLLPGSSANIYRYTTKLQGVLESLTTLTNPTDIAIRDAVITEISKYQHSWDDFPAFIGLPDGAAVIRWNGTEFVPQISNTSLADINGIDRFAYPAELFYYANSLISTSNIDYRKDSYDNNTQWSGVLNDYEYNTGVVSQNTTSVAIKDPLQYGVARMQIRLKKTDSANIKDAAGSFVPVGAYRFPLTGVIVGGMMPVGFDFAPTTTYPAYSEADMKFIYDSQVKVNGESENDYFYINSSADATKMTNTLVLQSYDHKKIYVVLEFKNNSDIEFKGLNGVVLPGTKFYLVGVVDPSEFSTDSRTEIRDRVFTQDYITTLNMKVTGLSKAYNVVPNLLSPRLELGVEMKVNWESTTPDEILF
jgi:hypothetical protein